MRGSVYKRYDSWYYSFKVKINGKWKKISRKAGDTKKEAEKKLRNAIIEAEKGIISDSSKTLDIYLSDWLTFIEQNRKLNTYNRYKGIINTHILPYIGKIKLQELSPNDIDRLINEINKKNISNTTIQNIYLVLNNALNRAYKLKLINENPCTFIDKPKRRRFEGTPLEPEDISRIYDKLDLKVYNNFIMYTALRIVIELGLRRGELSGLQWEDVDFDKNIITIKNNLIYSNGHTYLTSPKTSESHRKLYFSNNLKELLKSYKVQQAKDKIEYGKDYISNTFNDSICNFVMRWKDGHFVHPNYYTTKFKQILQMADLDKNTRFHDLRHTNATLLLKQGVDFKTIQMRLGHKDINTTLNIYSHVNIEMQKEAAEKLNQLLN